MLLEGGGAGVRKVSSQATGHQCEEELGKLDSESESSQCPLCLQLGQLLANEMECSRCLLRPWMLRPLKMCVLISPLLVLLVTFTLEFHRRESQELDWLLANTPALCVEHGTFFVFSYFKFIEGIYTYIYIYTHTYIYIYI